MKTKKKKRNALKIAVILTIAAAKGGAKNATPTILQESYHAALAVLNEIDHDQHGDNKAHEEERI
ncbi:hypothetical protein U27_03156 [Candidatus Vecturithrix granuli]|uniref:Uncharacterized protein n=1 Tax=Vecturithrix granuli TaxID=1499967 RepID=A0A081BV39_VECG1|nr:hypothetical protein U27_03156 [Candidatus Vecturithrix granuli]